MGSSFPRKNLSTLLVVCSAATAMPAVAELEEVLVTARKRDESIMKVPVTTTVLSEDTLDRYAIDDVKGIADSAPGLNFSSGPLASGVLVSMRGVGTGTNNPAIDQSVALVADGMQFTQGLAFAAATFDLAQVEVLKGPQALFFGKAAPAGVIAVRTADPGDESELIYRVGYEWAAEEQLNELIMSVPVADTLGFRLAAQFSEMDGYFRNSVEPSPILGGLGAAPATHRDFPNQDTVLLRGTAVWQPTDRFSARLKANYSDIDSQGTGGEPQLVSCPDGTNSVFNPVNFIGGENCKLDDKQNFSYLDPAAFPGILNGGVPFSTLEQRFGSLELNYDIGDYLSLTSVTGYYDVDNESMINGSITTEFGPPFAIQSIMERSDFTQEVRLTSTSTGPVNFLIGGFYQKGETDYLSTLPANQTYSSIGINLPPALANADHNVEADAISVFGQVLWLITPELELGVGARWTDEERRHKVLDRLPELLGGTAVPVSLATPKIQSDSWSPEVSLTYTPTDNLTVFGNLKQAYKSGSFDIGGAARNGDDKSFADERVRGGEIGLKSRLFNDTVVFNASAYYYKYADMQVETRIFNPAAGVVAVRTTNAASSELYGVDIDATYAPAGVEGLTLFGAVNWNIADYDEFDNAQCWTGQLQSQGCNVDLNGDGVGDAQDLSGEPLLRAPEWVASFGFDYERPLRNDLSLRVGSSTSYSSSYSASSTNLKSAYQDDYIKTNASVGLVGPDDHWKVEVIGDNLTDEIVFGNCAPGGYADNLLVGQATAFAGTGSVSGGPGGNPENACWAERGRSVWLRLTLRLL